MGTFLGTAPFEMDGVPTRVVRTTLWAVVNVGHGVWYPSISLVFASVVGFAPISLITPSHLLRHLTLRVGDVLAIRVWGDVRDVNGVMDIFRTPFDAAVIFVVPKGDLVSVAPSIGWGRRIRILGDRIGADRVSRIVSTVYGARVIVSWVTWPNRRDASAPCAATVTLWTWDVIYRMVLLALVWAPYLINGVGFINLIQQGDHGTTSMYATSTNLRPVTLPRLYV